MHLAPNLHLALHHARTDRSLADPRRQLPRRARPPGRLRSGLARRLHEFADVLAGEPAGELRLVSARRRA